MKSALFSDLAGGCRPMRAGLFIAIFGMGVSACGSNPEQLRPELAVIESANSGFGIRVTAPDTIVSGATVALGVRTYGGGCHRPGGETTVDQNELTVLVVPFDLVLDGTSVTGLNCSDDLRFFDRTIPLVFSDAGTASVTIRGLTEMSVPSDTIEVAIQIEVR